MSTRPTTSNSSTRLVVTPNPAEQSATDQNRPRDPGDGELRSLLVRVAIALVGTVSFVGLIGAIGAALTWLRFKEAGIPASEAISVVPAGERIVVGTNAIVYFLAFGLLIIAAVLAIPWGWLEKGICNRCGSGPSQDGLRAFGVSAALAFTGIVGAVLLGITTAHDPLWRSLLLGALLFTVLVPIVFAWRSLAERSRHPELSPRLMVQRTDWIALAAIPLIPFAFWAVTQRWDVALVVLAVPVLSGLVFGLAYAGRRLRKDDGSLGPAWPTAIGILLAVALYGAAWRAADFAHTAHVAPVAVLRETGAASDGQRLHEVITGIYVAANNDRIWVAGMVLDCNKSPAERVPQSGRLFAIPRSGVREYVIGVLGGWDDARKAADDPNGLARKLEDLHVSGDVRAGFPQVDLVSCERELSR